MCCVYYVYIALYILAEGAKLGLRRAIENGIKAVENYYNSAGYNPILGIRGIDSLMEIFKLDEEDIKSSGYVIDTLEASLWSLYHATGFKSAVAGAVSLGGDTDTVGAVTGSLAGVYYGFSNLPVDWMQELRNKELIYGICDKFYEKYK